MKFVAADAGTFFGAAPALGVLPDACTRIAGQIGVDAVWFLRRLRTTHAHTCDEQRERNVENHCYSLSGHGRGFYGSARHPASGFARCVHGIVRCCCGHKCCACGSVRFRVTRQPQVAPDLTDADGGFLRGMESLMLARCPLYTTAFRGLLRPGCSSRSATSEQPSTKRARM